jgi:hypothetical protein
MFTYTAFEKFELLTQGSLEQVALEVKRRMKTHRESQILIFSDSTGKQMDLDLSGTEKEALERLKIFAKQDQPSPAPTTGAGRPKLGVVAREISLLPSHWEWLTNQPGGSSATIRKLIDEKVKGSSSEKEKIKTAQEVTYKFLTAIAGDLPQFEEAIRFLYRKDKKKFQEHMHGWPKDIIHHAMDLAENVFA